MVMSTSENPIELGIAGPFEDLTSHVRPKAFPARSSTRGSRDSLERQAEHSTEMFRTTEKCVDPASACAIKGARLWP